MTAYTDEQLVNIVDNLFERVMHIQHLVDEAVIKLEQQIRLQPEELTAVETISKALENIGR